jgi:hypothetical protein
MYTKKVIANRVNNTDGKYIHKIKRKVKERYENSKQKNK